jgi:hypothetical protein
VVAAAAAAAATAAAAPALAAVSLLAGVGDCAAAEPVLDGTAAAERFRESPAAATFCEAPPASGLLLARSSTRFIMLTGDPEAVPVVGRAVGSSCCRLDSLR